MIDIPETRTVEEIQKLIGFIVTDAQKKFDTVLHSEDEKSNIETKFDTIFHGMIHHINEAVQNFKPGIEDKVQFENLVSIQHYVGIKHIEEFLEKNMPLYEGAVNS